MATGILRTPDERFASLPGYDFEPHHVEIDGLRIHYLDEGSGPVVLTECCARSTCRTSRCSARTGAVSWVCVWSGITSGGEAIFQRLVPGAQGQPHTTVAGGGHFIQEDRPEEMARIITDLIAAT